MNQSKTKFAFSLSIFTALHAASQKLISRTTFFISAFIACGIMSLATGCASGGFKLTRQYATWVNSQQVIIRVILYILTSVVFAVTMLIDLVIFNTLDFWDGRVSAGDYKFKDGNKTFEARHEFKDGTKLRRSTIQVFDLQHSLIQSVVLNELPTGEIEMFVDGKLRSKVSGISELPTASIFDGNGSLLEQRYVILPAILNGRTASDY